MSAQSPPHADNERPAPAVPAPRRRWLTIATGVTGEVLVTAGILLGLFVVWQLFYTDILSGRTQHAALEDTDFAEDFRVPPVTVIDGVVNAADTEAPIELIPDELKVYSPAGAPITAEPAAPETFGRLWVPRWGSDYVKPISQGTDREVTLDRLGIGHYQSTAMPGEVGNFAIAGHRTTYGSPFAGIAELRLGDALVVETKLGWYIYRWRNTEYVWPTGTGVLAPVPQNGTKNPRGDRVITLTSCHPRFSAAERIIGYGVFDRFQPRSAGAPAELNGGTA